MSIFRLLHVSRPGRISVPGMHSAASHPVFAHPTPHPLLKCPLCHTSHLHGKTHLPFKEQHSIFSSCLRPSSHSEKYSPSPELQVYHVLISVRAVVTLDSVSPHLSDPQLSYEPFESHIPHVYVLRPIALGTGLLVVTDTQIYD